jgi:hypothetical protein
MRTRWRCLSACCSCATTWRHLKKLPPRTCRGSSAAALLGGLRRWHKSLPGKSPNADQDLTWNPAWHCTHSSSAADATPSPAGCCTAAGCARPLQDRSVTGLGLNLTMFDQATTTGVPCDASIRALARAGPRWPVARRPVFPTRPRRPARGCRSVPRGPSGRHRRRQRPAAGTADTTSRGSMHQQHGAPIPAPDVDTHPPGLQRLRQQRRRPGDILIGDRQCHEGTRMRQTL